MAKDCRERRWRIAQERELRYYMKNKDKVRNLWSAEQKETAKEMVERISTLKCDIRGMKVLQVGMGPIFVINYIEAGERHGIDPLMDAFAREFSDIYHGVLHLIKGIGEQLPYKDGYFDLVISTNVIDHVKDPEGFLMELHRVIKDKGYLYFSVGNYRWPGCFLRTFTEKIIQQMSHSLLIDKKHPYTYTRRRILRSLQKSGFAVIGEWNEPYAEFKRKLRRADRFSVRILRGYGPFAALPTYYLCVRVK